MQDFWVAFDGGGSKTRLLLGDWDGNILARELGGYANYTVVTPKEFVTKVRPLFRRIRAAVKKYDGRVSMMSITGPVHSREIAELGQKTFGDIQFAFVSEAELAFAAHKLRAGVILVAGTGAISVGFNRAGMASYCGGIGYQFGDEGSGHWIGQEGLSASMRCRDGREYAPILFSKFKEFAPFRREPHYLSPGEWFRQFTPSRVAAFTPLVFEAAREGDDVAKRICREAGRHLADLVLGVVRKLDFDPGPIPLGMTGGVFNGKGLILTSLKRRLNRCGRTFELLPPITEPIEHIHRVLVARKKGKKWYVS